MKEFLHTLFSTRRVAFYLNLVGLTLAFVIFYVLMAEVKWVHGFDRQHRDADRLYKLQVYDHSNGYENVLFTGLLIDGIWNNKPMGVEAVAASVVDDKVDVIPSDSAYGKTPIRMKFQGVLPGYTDVFTFDMMEGSDSLTADKHEVIVPLSQARKLFGERDSYLGLTFEPAKDAKTYWQIAGIYRDFPKNTVVSNVCYMLVPEAYYQRKVKNERVNNNYQCIVRLHEDADPNLVMKDFLRHHYHYFGGKNPPSEEELADAGIRLIPLHDTYFMDKAEHGGGGNRYVTMLFMALAILVVAIAAINYMNFAMAMIPYQIKSINVRKILGESMSSLRLSLIGQALVVAVGSLALAFVALWVIIQNDFLGDLLHCDLAWEENTGILIGMVLVALLVVLGAGAYPIWYQTTRKPAMVINGSFALSERGRNLRKLLIGVQFAASLAVASMLLLMNAQHHYIANASVGYARDSIFYLNSSKLYKTPVAEVVKNELLKIPDVTGASRCREILGEKDVTMEWSFKHDGQQIQLQVYVVEPDFLEVAGVKLTEGRNFRPEDECAFILNESARKEYGNIPLGTGFPIRFASDKDIQLVGYSEDIHTRNMRNVIGPSAFMWNRKYDMNNMLIRVSSPDRMSEVIGKVRTLCKEQGFKENEYRIYTKDSILERAYREESNQTTLVLTGSIVSLLISLIGVFGLVLFETQAKRKEIGVRKVFGATTKGILLMFNAQYLRILLACFVVAAPIAYYLYTIWIETFAYRTPVHWWLFAVAFLIVSAVVCLTVTVQSWRAANERPVDTIMK